MGALMELEVTFVSHATLKIRGVFGTLLCDPWILNEPIFNLSTWKFPAARIPPEEVVRDVDYLFITHSHEDHFHIPSIDLISRDVQVLLPAYDNHPSLRAHTTERVLRSLGFHRIRRIRSWETFQLGGVTPLTVIPSAKSRSQDWENAGFVIDHPGCRLINMNDNLNDDELCDEIVERWPSFDIGFVQSGGVTMFPGCFKMDEEAMRAAAAKRKVAFVDQRRFIRRLNPRHIAPFAGDFCWLHERYFHNNWANRTTPLLFEQMVDSEFPGQSQFVLLYPSDVWTPSRGVVRNHPEVNWGRFLGEVKRVQARLRPKIDRIERWLHDVSLDELEARSRRRTTIVQASITKDYIDFDARFRMYIEGEHSNFGFVMKANPKDGFSFDWNDRAPVTQTLHVPEHIWAAVLEGKLMWNIIQWVGKADQHVEFTRDMGRFWFWLEYHIDIFSKNIQCILEPELVPGLEEPVRPKYATFPMPGEWQAAETEVPRARAVGDGRM